MDINKDLVAASATPLVLAILAEGDSYGYAILKRVNKLSGGDLQWTDGMLYPVLHRLERQGHIRGKWIPLRPAGSASTITSRHGARRSWWSSASNGRWWTRRCGTSGERSRFRLGQRYHPGCPMADPAKELGSSESLEEQVEQWRSYLRRRQAIRTVDVEELEDHLRGEVTAL